MTDRSVLVRLQANIADFRAQMQQAERSVKGVGDEAEKSSRQATTSLGRLTESAQKNRVAWDDAGTALTAFGAVTVLALGATVKAAIDWESAWTGVLKTVDGTEQELAGVEQGLRGLARTLPSTHGEIAAVAEAAGQLGIKTGDIVSFTRTMVDLGETTNLSAEEAATSIAQMMNVMRTAPEDVGRLGATLVALGNAGASTEKQLIEMSQRISGAAAVVGMSEADVLAFANAVASMGIEVESGGSSVSRVLTDMSKAAQSGGAELEVFAETAGVSAAEFSRAFLEDPAEAFASFIEGLGGIQEAGGNVFAVLDELGLSDVRVSQALLGMASSGDLLRESLDLGAEAWEENTALVEEAAKRYDTTAAKLAMARNGITDAAIEIGNTFLPVLADMAEGLADVAGGFADLPDPIKEAVGGLAGVAGVGALAGGAFLLLFPRVIETYKAFQTLQKAAPGVASGLGAVGKAAGIAGLIWAAASALDGLVNSMRPAPPTMEDTTRALLNMSTSMTDIDAQFRSLSSWSVISEEIDGLGGAIERLTKPGVRDNIGDFVAKVITLGSREGNDERERLVDQFNQMGESLAFMVQSGNARLAAKQFEFLAEQWEAAGGDLEELKDLLPAYEETLAGVDNEQTRAAESAELQAQAAAVLAQDLDIAFGSLTSYAGALGLSEEATEKLIEDSNALGESLAGFVDPLGVYTGLLEEKRLAEEESARKAAETAGAGAESWRDFVGDVRVSFADYMQQLRDQVTAQEDWQLNMLILAGRVSEGTLAELARMGPEGAPLVQDLVNQSDVILDEFDDITARRSKEATDAWGAQLTMAAPVLAEIGRIAGSGVVAELAAQLQAGTTTVAEIARQYGINLAGGINPILKGLGQPIIDAWGTPRPQGFVGPVAPFMGPVKRNAEGNLYEDHVAQFAQAGDWRVWAEPETGGEAYIPLHPGKRTRSVDIWRQVGDRLGVQFAEFATGGFSSVGEVPRPPSTAPYGPPLSTAGNAAMEKAYGDTVDWLKANLAPELGPGIGWEAMMGALRGQFPGLALHSGFRPGSITATGNLSYHARGRAVDVPPRMDVFNWLAEHYPNSRELIFSPAGGRQVWNGLPHLYGEPTRGDHWDHVHWAMAKGGILDFFRNGSQSGRPGSLLNPHVRDAGGPLLPGYTFNGTGAAETVVSNHRYVPAETASGPLDLSDSTIDRLAVAMVRGAGAAVGYREAAQARAVSSRPR